MEPPAQTPRCQSAAWQRDAMMEKYKSGFAAIELTEQTNKPNFFPLAGAAGVALYFATLFRYHSETHRQVAGKWSYPYFGIIIISALILLWLVVRAVRHLAGRRSSSLAIKLVDIGVLLWGVAYMWEARLDPIQAGRIDLLNFFGSCNLGPAFLDFGAMVLICMALISWLQPRFQGKWTELGLAIGSTVVLLLVMEGALRFKVAIAPSTEGFPSCSTRSWKRRYVRLNQEGWRDVEHSVTAAPGTRRVLIVGDSIAFGWGIQKISNRLGEQLAGALSVKTGEHWESLNASKGGMNTLQEFPFVQEMLPYRPDLVILVYVFNDMDYLAPQISPRLSSAERFYPWWIAYRNSYLAQEVMLRLRIIYYWFWGGGAADPYLDENLLSRHLQDVSRLVSLAGSNGAVVRVAPFEYDPSPRIARRYQFFVQHAEAAGIPLCSLQNSFHGRSLRRLTVNSLDGHPNELANQLATQSVVDCLSSVPAVMRAAVDPSTHEEAPGTAGTGKKTR